MDIRELAADCLAENEPPNRQSDKPQGPNFNNAASVQDLGVGQKRRSTR
jgi:hypothetical protein